MNSALKLLAVLILFSTSSLALATGPSDVRVGDLVAVTYRVMDGFEGTAAGIFPDGSISVRFKDCCGNFHYEKYSYNDVASQHSDACRDGLCPGQAVVTSTNASGTAIGITPDNRVIVRFRGCCGWPDYGVFDSQSIAVSH